MKYVKPFIAVVLILLLVGSVFFPIFGFAAASNTANSVTGESLKTV